MPNADSSSKRTDLGAWLKERRTAFAAQRRQWSGREDRWSWTRVAIVVAVIVAWVALAGQQPWVAPVATAVGIALFVWAVRVHGAALAQREHFDRLLLMLDEAEQRLGGQIVCVRSHERPSDENVPNFDMPRVLADGATWELTEQERDDLDLYAPPVGVFGLINRTSTPVGARRLRDVLENPCLEPERIRTRQGVVRWLADNDAARLHIMADLASLRLEHARFAKLLGAIDGARPLETRLAPKLMRGWSIVSSALAAWVFANALVGYFIWLPLIVPLAIINWFVMSGSRDQIDACLKGWQNTAWSLKGFQIATQTISRHLPDEDVFATLRRPCNIVSAADVLPKLARRTAWVERGGIFWQGLNLIALVDWHVTHAILRVSAARRNELLEAASVLGELDAWCSLAAFATEQPVTTWPEMTSELHVEIEQGRHPLVDPEQVVPTSLTLDHANRVWVVTGSNMAGKSTFLRMTGLNLLLAQVGSVVVAERMHWSPVRLITDLRARDNLAQKESYFLAEVRHLRRMIKPPAGAQPVFGLIDEPFRGTNSHDQSAASVAVLQHLVRSSGLYIIATHDLHLTELADGATVQNFHFREDLSAEELVFDYTLHPGPALTSNALRILEIEDYPTQLVREAREWLDENYADKNVQSGTDGGATG